MRKTRKMSAVFLTLAALLLFVAQSAHAFTSVSAVDALVALQADPTAVMFDTRTVDEHNHQKQPWQGSGLDTTAPAGTAVWTVGGVDKMPITVPYWYAGITRVVPGPPEDEAEVRAIIGGLLEAGEINYNTPIYLVCRTAYRSYYMAEWMDTTTFAPGTGAAGQADSQPFTNLINIDGDTPPVDPANAQGGMKEWNLASLPLYPGNFVPAQVFSKLPADGYTETAVNTVTFTMSVLEPSTGGLGYPAIRRVSLEIDGVENNSDTTDTTGALWTDYNIVSTPLANGTYAWEAKVANNTAEDRVSWSSHYLAPGMGERAVTVDAVVTPVFTNVSAATAFAALEADPTAVMFDTRTVDEHNHQKQPWQGSGLDTTAPAGTAMWTVGGVNKLPITVPYWYAGIDRVVPGPPEDEAESISIIEGLLAAGEIDFNTPIYLICRTAYRSYYMAQWMNTLTFYNARTGVSDYFTNLINIDGDTPPVDPANAQGGMKEWNLTALPIYGSDIVPPQVFSKTPADGLTENGSNDVNFTVSVLEASTGGFVPPAVSRVALTIDGLEAAFDTAGTTGLWTDYAFTPTVVNGSHVWNTSSTNSAGISWNSHYLDAGPGDRSLTVDVTAAFSNMSAVDALAALESDPTAVMFDTRTVDEHNHLRQPWQGTGLDTTGPAGTAMWTVGGVDKLPITVPYWYAGDTRTVPGPPEDAAEVRAIIEGLLAAGEIDFGTPIYLVCRTAYRSYYMAQWMDTQTFYNARTGITSFFTNLINIDSDLDPANAQGGMKEWNLASLPLYGGNTVPPQVFSKTPVAGAISSSADVTFTMSVLEASTGGFIYPTVSRVSLTVDGLEAAFDTAGTTALWTDYSFPQTLANGPYVWNSSVENSAGTSWNSHYLGSGLGSRTLTVDFPTPTFTNVTAQAAYDDLVAVGSGGGPVAVMFDTRTVDEYYGCGQPWNSTACPDTNTLVNGTPVWTVTNAGVSGKPDPDRLPYLVPYWITANSGTGSPEDPAEAREIIEELLATGAINFDTRIYLLCRTAYRSYYMAQWMNTQTFYNARTGTSEYFTQLFNIDSDQDPANAQGGMKEWKATGLPVWYNGGNQMMPAQIYANLPDRDGYTENNSTCITFNATILEPTAGVNGGISGYSSVLNTCVGTVAVPSLATKNVCSTLDTPPNTVVNNYQLKMALKNGTYMWTAGAENYHITRGSWQQASPNATQAGLDTRTLIVNAACTDMDCDGYSLEGGSCGPVDCDDSNATIYPGSDSDGDGYAACSADCDDSNAAINPGAIDDTCDGIDNNCSGTADDGFVSTDTSCGLGECVAVGTTLCVNGALGDTCTPGTPAADDASCDGLDNDCNGLVDDGYLATDTTCGVGVCSSIGLLECVSGSEVNSCVIGTPTEDPETSCTDNLDNDCDGLTDASDSDCGAVEYYCDADADGFVSSSISGSCLGTGCEPAGCVLTVGSDCDDANALIFPGADDSVCDGVDNNCSGTADDGFVSTDTSCGTGECSAVGTTLCVNGALGDTCTPGTPAADDTTCDGLDNDCNGSVDDGYIATDTTCGVGVCSSIGLLECVAGVESNSCTAGTPTEDPEASCTDNLDNDCDGLTDASDSDCGAVEYYCDVDADGSVSSSVSGSCLGAGCEPAGCVLTVGSDCDDANASVFPGADDSVCDGVDNNCSGTADDGFVSTDTSCGTGECSAVGTTLCVNGALGDTCTSGTPAADDTTCDGLDNDCNGSVDDGYVATDTTCGVGVCSSIGLLECVAGVESNSCMAGTPTEDPEASCTDNLDNDCDGLTDASDSDCGAVEYYCDADADGSVSSSVSGSCLGAGCEPAGCVLTVGSDCDDANASVFPGADDSVCDGVDNNCSGTADDGFVSTDTTCGVGECSAVGTTLCVNGKLGDTCTPGTPSEEVCDGVDNDCNGSVDENLPSIPTTCGVGECKSTGVLDCIDGGGVDTCTPGTPVDEICDDGLDNNCDGQVDENCGVVCTDADGDGYSVEGGECGPIDCNDRDTAIFPGADDSICDGVDNNCSGTADDGFVSTDTTCGVGECSAVGTTLCVNGKLGDTCTPGTPSEEVCDGVDNDCNGSVDENLPSIPTTCGVGECKSTGVLDCIDGGGVDTCTPGTPVDEICDDGLDNNCDGQVDENCGVVCTDADGDGYSVEGGECGPIDCNDDDETIYPGADEICDGLDNDCDGEVDEDFVIISTTCGRGACMSTGEVICVDGEIIDTCSPGAPQVEGPAGDPTCGDTIDNDCDGRIDSYDWDCYDRGERRMRRRGRRGRS